MGIVESTQRAAGTAIRYGTYLTLSGAASVVLLIYMVVPAHLLGRSEFGLFSSLFSLVVFLGAVFTAAQTYVAGIIASQQHSAAADLRPLVSRIVLWCAVLAVGWTFSAPLVAHWLRASILSVAIVGVIAVATLAWAALLGVLQGGGRFVALGAVNLAQAALRMAALVLTIGTGDINLVLGATAVSMVPAIVLVAVVVRLGSPRQSGQGASRPSVALGSILPMLIVGLVVGFPGVGDLIIIRAVHDAETAGDFAVVALVGRVLIFLAIVVNTVLFPLFVSERDSLRGTRTLLVATGVVSVILAVPLGLILLQPATIVSLAALPSTAAAKLLPAYAVASYLFAVGSLGCYFQLARGNRTYLFGALLPFIGLLMGFCAFVTELAQLMLCLSGAALLLVVINIVVPVRAAHERCH
ncbi:hypothetical protein [Cryobacterium sp. Y82]|uniref:hypothetical protein n=1 Tax=Cryobacterium sp. Y82 TaxID=2045017 RepID=UPI000CE2ED2D|nr:hypothetical protein [Cryobacterium sp. Y82]